MPESQHTRVEQQQFMSYKQKLIAGCWLQWIRDTTNQYVAVQTSREWETEEGGDFSAFTFW